MSFRSNILLSLLLAAPAAAQQSFTTQVMVVPAFRGADRGLAVKASDIIRGRVAGAFPGRELHVVSGGDVQEWLQLSGFDEDAVLTEGELRELEKKYRADERITGAVTRVGGRVHIDARLDFIRDLRLWQPLTGDGASVNDAAESVAREAIAARRQVVPLRECENLLRANQAAKAAAAAATAIAAYPRAVAARACLLNSLARQPAQPDTVVAVSRALLGVSPKNPIGLEDLAEAYDAQHDASAAAPVWMRLLATDSTNADLASQVVNALAAEGNTRLAQPLVDRAVAKHDDNLPLLKLQWLVHLANDDWTGAIAAGEKMLARDAAAQADPDFYRRLAMAYRSDSQPTRALGAASEGVARFPKDAPLYVTYLELLRAENAVALARGLQTFPDNAELHVLAAQSAKTSGNADAALAETRRALAANPNLPHGYLQLAQLELQVGELDSAYEAITRAARTATDSVTAGEFALARGNSLFKAAGTSHQRADFQQAMKFLTLADRITPSAEAKFLLGASALSVSQSAATDAPATKSCDLSRLADSTLTEAQINLVSGGSVAPTEAKTYLDYVAKLRPYVDEQLKTYCLP